MDSRSMPAKADETRILMLHRVLEDRPTSFGLPSCYRLRGTSLTPAEWYRVVEHSQPIVPLADVERALATRGPLPTGSVLTFDDGYREHVDLVAPMLRDLGLSATFYVASGLHGEGRKVAAVDAWYLSLIHI